MTLEEMNKATHEVAQARTDEMKALIMKGMSSAQAVRFAMSEASGFKWGVSDRQIRTYYKRAWEQLADDATTVSRPAYFALAVGRLEDLYQQCIRVRDFKTALSILSQLIKLLRLDAPSADFDWRKAAAAAGLEPSDIFNKVIATIATAAQQEKQE